MPCGRCGSTRTAPERYEYTSADGTKKTFSSETEARAKVARSGGSYKKV